MTQRLNELHLERGRLLERITTQRYVLMNEVQPVRVALERVDSVVDMVRAGVDTVKRYPAVAGVAAAVLCIFNFRRVFRVARRGFMVWRTWKTVRERLMAAGWTGFR